MAGNPGGPAAAGWNNAATGANNAQPRSGVMLCNARRPPAIAVSWRNYDFGRVRRGGVMPVQDLVISSTGGRDLANIAVNIAGTQFAIDNPGGFAATLPPGGSTTVRIRFTPNVYGQQNGVVTITSNAANEPNINNILLRGQQFSVITFVLENEEDGTKLENVKLKVKQAGQAELEKLTDSAGRVEWETDVAGNFEVMLGDHAHLLEFCSLTSA